MNPEDANRFSEIVAGAALALGTTVEAERINIYYKFFKKFTIDEFAAAMAKAVQNHPYPSLPVPGEIFQYLSKEGQAQSEKHLAEDVWSKIYHAVERVGPHQTFRCDDKRALAAVRLVGGWKKLCESTHDQLVWKKKEFLECYENLQFKSLDQLPTSIPGIKFVGSENQFKIGEKQ